MTDQTGAPAGSEAMAASTPANDATPRSLSDMIAEARQAPESADPAPEPNNEIPAQAENAAPPQEDPGEAPTDAEPAEQPPIEPPRSWTQAEKERFQSLPRETQEYLHTREQEREREFRRSQNDVAEERKAVKAERDAAEKARQQYEANLPALMQELQNAQNGAFADVRTVDDVQKLAAEDPFRYLQWQAHQTKLQAVNAQLEQSKREHATAEQSKWTEHVQKENALAATHIPELADKDKGPALTNRVATEILPEYGFTPSELTALANGSEKLSIYDHRLQRLLATAVKYADIQKAKVAATAKSIPPVQRPGVAKPAGSVQSEAFTKTSAKIDNGAGDHRDLGALLGAMRRA
jgi:hypothetical protein